MTDFDGLSSSQQYKDLKQFWWMHDGKFHPPLEKELWSCNAGWTVCFIFCFVFFLMVSPIHYNSSMQHDKSEYVFNRNVYVEPISDCMPSWGGRGRKFKTYGNRCWKLKINKLIKNNNSNKRILRTVIWKREHDIMEGDTGYGSKRTRFKSLSSTYYLYDFRWVVLPGPLFSYL